MSPRRGSCSGSRWGGHEQSVGQEIIVPGRAQAALMMRCSMHCDVQGLRPSYVCGISKALNTGCTRNTSPACATAQFSTAMH